ncbi:hypothetical protein E3N88_38527 [Mikania micrantha]|uniref:Uncharacterized protein n=1 Tax=Mikania micrantha TaxID=192012 RepID=A0A5N6LUJ2_9ASTR|nr:hypothetical protein E3N88_38527 [Mikania micrantha]
MSIGRETMIVFEKYERFGSKQRNWAYWAPPRPIAVRDGHQLGPSRNEMILELIYEMFYMIRMVDFDQDMSRT